MDGAAQGETSPPASRVGGFVSPSTSPIEGSASFRRGARALLTGGLVGKVAGILREVALAAAYGTSQVTAAFRISQTATLIPLNLIASDALSSGFLPLYARIHRESAAAADTFYRSSRLFLVGPASVVAIVMMLFPDAVVSMLAPGLAGSARALAANMVTAMALSIPLFIAGALNSFLAVARGFYKLAQLRATIQSVFLLAGVAVAVVADYPLALAWAFTASTLAYCAWSALYVRNLGLLGQGSSWLGWRASFQSARPLGRLMRGLLLLPLLIQANEAMERVVGSHLGSETVAATEFANFIVDTCVTLIAVPLGLAGLASLGASADAHEAARQRARGIIPGLLIVTLPLSLVLTLHADFLVRVMYGRGSFGQRSVELTGVLLQGFSIGLWLQVLGYVLLKVYSGTMQTKKLVLATAASVVVSVGCMIVAVPTANALFIGLSGSSFGLVSTLIATVDLGVARHFIKWIAKLLPGAVLVGGISWPFIGADAPTAVAGIMIAGLAWFGYVLAVPSLRTTALGILRP